jgi:hypothetical protein
MNKASPVEMRKALEAVETLKKAGLLFVPMPVLSEADHAELIQDMMRRFEDMEQGLKRTSTPELKKLLAAAVGASVEDFGDDYLETMLTIGQGMFWSEELDIAARELAAKVKEEFENILGAGE